jgi:hypothetical protein
MGESECEGTRERRTRREDAKEGRKRMMWKEGEWWKEQQ